MFRILHLDDAADDRLLIGLHLSRIAADLQVRGVATVEEAFACIDAEPVDCVLCDYFLAASSGLAFMKELRRRGSDIPVVFLLGQGSEEIAVAAFRAGAADYLTKDEIYDNFGILAERLLAVCNRAGAAPGADAPQSGMAESILDCIDNLVLVADQKGLITYCAPSITRVLGFQPGEVLGEGWWRLTRKDAALAQEKRARVAALAQRTMPFQDGDYELQLYHRDGSLRHFLWHDYPGPGETVIGIGIDLTENYRVSEALRSSEERYRTLLENATFPIIITADDGAVLFINRNAQQVFGYTAEEASMLNAADVYVQPEQRRIMLERLREKNSIQDYDLQLRRKNGELFWAVLSARFINFDGRGALFVALLDITERRNIEIALRQSEKRYRLLAENIRDVIWTMDLEGRFTYVSPSIKALCGFTPDEVKKKSLEELVDPRFLPIVIAGLAEAKAQFARGGQVDERELEIVQVCKDGSFVTTGVMTRLLYKEEDGSAEILGVTRDISERKRVAEELEAINRQLEEQTGRLAEMNRELDSFAYTISHDLRAPLRRIANYIQLLNSDESLSLPDSALDMLERIDQSSRTLYGLIEDILKFSRSSRGEIVRATVNLSEMAAAIVREQTADRKPFNGESLQLEIQPGMKCTADPVLMRVVLENLLSNAIKFTAHAAQPLIGFSAAESGSDVVYSVRDNGAGFDPARRGELFIPFTRLHEDAEFQGTGVGLATVKRIIERHGGRIWAEGAIGQGAVFYFTVPDPA